MPPKAQPPQPQLSIIKYSGTPEDAPIDKWIRLFERKADALDWTENDKVTNFCDYIDGEAFRWYLSEIFEVSTTWQEVKESMTARFGACVLDPFRSFIHCRQGQEQPVREYYEQKRRLGELAGLSTAHIISGLTDGLLPELDCALTGTELKTIVGWLSAAQRLELTVMKKPAPMARPPQQIQRPADTQASGDARFPRSGAPQPSLPKSECRHCATLGLKGQLHWHNVCPYRFSVSSVTEGQGNEEGDPK